MEKSLSTDERIKRAEEIYYKRKYQDISKKSNKHDKKEFGMLKKMVIQIVMCILIYIIFYIIQNSNYIFSDDIFKKTNEVLSYDINIENLYKLGTEFINTFINNLKKTMKPLQDENIVEINFTNEAYTSETESVKKVDFVQEENIGGESDDINVEEKVELTQMEKDSKYILEMNR